jgi:molybdopterin molybdotransferase
MMGLPVLARLRRRFAGQIAVWPFEPLDPPIALVEIWPSLYADAAPEGMIRDAHQVRSLAARLAGMPASELAAALSVHSPEEGWIFGVPQDHTRAPERLTPPPLRDDCFAMPQGAHWTPVDTALALLRDRLAPVAGSETIAVIGASGRILAERVTALRSHPPSANTAVDGFGFAHAAIGAGPQNLPLVAGRAAAGLPFKGVVPPGHAIPVLTGASLPEGVDTVVLQEDCRASDIFVAFHGPVKKGANTRRAGEDMVAGDEILPEGRQLTSPDLGTLTAAGVARVRVRQRLRVALLSTGSELRDPGEAATDAQIYDANRPMLSAVLARWGYEVIDLGRVPDDASALRKALDKGAHAADAILTSGGASAGAEDHVSRLLTETGSMAVWRIAVKPGRPLALGVWNGAPVFGLPGNPVAAFVCTLVFARPALAQLAGAVWRTPQGFMVPAAFTKAKKAGRREYLRARLREGRAEVFASEGSGRVSGLSWAEGLVELPDAACDISPGTPVHFIPWGSFGL